ncbi:MAG: hypothetical protein HC919_02375 [Oscillatoriales cyanobacterium SM2_2_1]|nr:hypothetical protein [Oscillatoriales cyanobacterium SM2_2_1]
MQTKASQPTSAPRSPSVPMAVYRELSAELQSTRAKLALMEIQNEQLLQQNQKLIAEVEPILQASQKIQQVLNPLVPAEPADLPPTAPSAPVATAPEPKVAPTSLQATVAAMQPQVVPAPKEKKTEKHPDKHKPIATIPQPQPRTDTPESGSLSGGWLLLTMILVIVTSFGAGYLLMRPLISQR